MMEWYPTQEEDTLVLPKHQDSLFDSLPPSTDSRWSQWGINSTTSDVSFPNNSSIYSRPDFQFNQLTGADDHMDDIFVNSLLKEDHQQSGGGGGGGYYNDNHQYEPFCISPESQSSFMPEEGNSTSMMLDFLCPSRDNTNGAAESSEYYGTGGFSFNPSAADWENNDQLIVEMERKVLPSSDQDSSKERSMEESVLNELETAMSQLNDKTRLCFRDSLYRLARSTKGPRPTHGQNASFSLNNPHQLASENQMSRSGTTAAEVAESETNAIDRAVANLMFNNADEFTPTISSQLEDISTAGIPGSYNYNMNNEMHHHSQPKILKTESQGPVFSMVNQKQAGLPDFYLRNFVPGSEISWTAHGD